MSAADDAIELAGRASQKAAAGLDSGSDSWLAIVLVVVIGVMAGAIFLGARWIDAVGARRRKRPDKENDSDDATAAAGGPGVRMLAANVERLAEHVKEASNLTRDTAFAVERCTAALEHLASVASENARETRAFQVKMHEHLGQLEGALRVR